MTKNAKPDGQPKLSIIIPALNEAKRIGSTLDALSVYLDRHRMASTEVILVISDSHDDTLAIARQKLKSFENARIIESGPPGKGFQVKRGMLEATGRYRLFMDADMATPLHHIVTACQFLAAGADVVIAVRDLAVIHTGLRRYISEFSNLIARSVLVLPFRDTQCGFKAFRGEVADDLFARQQIMRWVFDMEILAIARHRRYKIVPFMAIDWVDVPEGTFQKVGLKDTFSTLADIARIRWHLWMRAYA